MRHRNDDLQTWNTSLRPGDDGGAVSKITALWDKLKVVPRFLS